MSLESAFKGLDKRASKDEPMVFERARAGDSHSTKNPAEMPPKDEMATRGRGPSGRTGPSQCSDDFEDDVSDDAKRFRFAKQPKLST
jgi:hypothetical protein